MEVTIQERRTWRKYLHSKVSLAVLAILIIILAKASFIAHSRRGEVSDTATRVSSEEKDLLARKAFLEAEIAKLNTPEGRESELRDKYGVAKTGEQMAVIVEPENQNGMATTSTNKGWFASVLSFFRIK
jgi:cell division protein FtsB